MGVLGEVMGDNGGGGEDGGVAMRAGDKEVTDVTMR